MTVLLQLFVLALAAAVGVAVAAAPLGCVIVWRRMAYFGDATAHAAILGVALALVVGTPLFVGVLPAALAMALLVSRLTGRGLGEDTILGVLAHGALAMGLIAVSLVPGAQVDLAALLLGDVLAISWSDVVVIWVGALCVLALLAWRWRALLTATLDPDLATADGHNPAKDVRVVLIALALTVAIAVKIVGVLLVAALLIIPAATARLISSTPEMMVARAVMLGTGSAVLGLGASFVIDTPSGPSIVFVASVMFAIAIAVQSVRQTP